MSVAGVRVVEFGTKQPADQFENENRLYTCRPTYAASVTKFHRHGSDDDKVDG